MAHDAAFLTVLLEAARKAREELSEPGMDYRPGKDTFTQILRESLGVYNKTAVDDRFKKKPRYDNADLSQPELTMLHPSSKSGQLSGLQCFNADYRIDAAKLWRRVLARAITSKPSKHYFESEELFVRMDALSLLDELEGIVKTGRNRCLCICEEFIYVLEHFNEEVAPVSAVIAHQELSDDHLPTVH